MHDRAASAAPITSPLPDLLSDQLDLITLASQKALPARFLHSATPAHPSARSDTTRHSDVEPTATALFCGFALFFALMLYPR